MVGQPLWLDAERADQGEMPGLTGQHRQHLAELHARGGCGNRLEFAADVNGRIGLGVPGIDVAGRALQVQEDD